MADSSPYTKPPSTFTQANLPIRPKPIINKGKSYSGILFKSLFFTLFVIVLPLFPSQAPDFVNQTILTKLWELLHLLFIGIAVAYGLFSRRNVEPEIEIETHSTIDNTPCYVSRMFPVSSIFSDECEDPCGSDENRMMMHCWNSSQYYENSTVIGEQYIPQLPIPEDNFSHVRYDGTNEVQAWNSEYYYGEPVVVVAQPYYTVGECDEIVGYKPLGLPVRSLRSSAGDLDSPNNTNESDSSSDSRVSSRGSVKSRDRKFGDLGPSNWDQKFNDAIGSASPIPWRSRSRRMKSEENHAKFSDAAGSASSIPWQESSRRVEIEENLGEFNDVARSTSPVPWQTRSRRMENEENYGKFDDVVGSASPIPWQESYEENQGEFIGVDRSASPIPWQTRSQRMVSEENHGMFNDAPGSASPIPWRSRSRRIESDENHGTVTRSSHFRPLLVDETKFESLNSQAFQSTSFSSHTSVHSSSDSILSDNMNLEAEEMGQKKTSDGSSSENMNFQEEDSGENMTSHGSSLRFRKMATREKYAAVSRPSHVRPMSVDETQIELFSSRSFQSTGSFSSQTSLFSSLDSVPSENINPPKEDLGAKKSSHGSSSSGSPSPPAGRRNGEALSKAFHSRGYSVGSLLRDDMKSSLKDDWMGLSGQRSEDQLCNKESGLHLQSDTEKSANLAKVPLKGKSVRTRRASRLNSETMRTGARCSKQTDAKVEKKPDVVEPVLMKREKLRKGGPETMRTGDICSKQTEEKVEKVPDIGESVLIKREKLRKGGPETMRTGDICNKHTEEKVEMVPDIGESALIKIEKLRKGGPDQPISKQNIDPPSLKPEITFCSYPKRDKEEPSKNVSKEDPFIELENFQIGSDEDRVSECVNDPGLDSEVDKKASEFIAKFKAQIRLQKEASMDRSRGLRTMKRVLGDT